MSGTGVASRLSLLAALLAEEGAVALSELGARYAARCGSELAPPTAVQRLVQGLPWLRTRLRRAGPEMRVFVVLRPGTAPSDIAASAAAAEAAAAPVVPPHLQQHEPPVPSAHAHAQPTATATATAAAAAAAGVGSAERQALRVLRAEGAGVRLSEWQQCSRRHLGCDPHQSGPLRDFLLRVPGARLRGSGADTTVYLDAAAPGSGAKALAQAQGASPETLAAVHRMLRATGPVRLEDWNRMALAHIGHDPHPIGSLTRWLCSLPGVALAGQGSGMTVSLSGAQPTTVAVAAAATPPAVAETVADAEEASRLVGLIREEGPTFMGNLVSMYQRRYGVKMATNVVQLVQKVPELVAIGAQPSTQVCLVGDPRNAAGIARNEEKRRAQRQQIVDLVRQFGSVFLRDLRFRFATKYGTDLLGSVKEVLSFVRELQVIGTPPDARVVPVEASAAPAGIVPSGAASPRSTSAESVPPSTEEEMTVIKEMLRREGPKAFEDNDIDGETLNELTEDDMRMLGMEPLTDRKRLVHALHTFRATGLAAVDDSVVGAIAKEHTQASEDILTALCNKANVCVWLLSLEIPFESVQLFDAAGVDGVALMHLSDKDLQDIGVSSLGQRRKVTRRTDRMRSSYFAALEAHFSGAEAGSSEPDEQWGEAATCLPSPGSQIAAALRCAAGKRAPPNEYVCPITMEMMGDPVVAPDGFTYEREAITHWLVHGKKTSPMTGQAMPPGPLVPTIALRSAIKAFKEANGL
eukprot:m51a1_g6002 putative wd sam and u-box domain-containing protein 1 isoform x2 (750) ;mRNA; r:22387-25819